MKELSCKFINHASYLIVDDSQRVLLDPWLQGSVFNDGWDLLHESETLDINYLAPTAIWISHEHPDHFHIPTLLKIPAERRPHITVYFRSTKDSRVLNWCRSVGFLTIECVDGAEYQLGPRSSLKVFRNGIEDSAALFMIGNKKFLNLNDCLFFGDRELKRLHRKTGPIDYVAYICGYAEGSGSQTNSLPRQRMLSLYQSRFMKVGEEFKEAELVGFAAFKYFCHRENSFQNDSLGFGWLSELAARRQERVSLAVPSVDLMDSSTELTQAVAFWERYLSVVSSKHSTKPQDFDTLLKIANEFNEGLERLGRLALFVISRLPSRLRFSDLEFWVRDHEKMLRLSLRNRSVSHRNSQSGAGVITVTSDALTHALKHDYGLSTLLINGRFESSPESLRILHRYSVLGLLLASGQTLGIRFLIRNFVRILRNV